MGKHNRRKYPRAKRDHYPTRPRWPVTALAEHVPLRGKTVWEMACGNDDMTRSLLAEGCKRVFTSDVHDYGNGQDAVFDFLTEGKPKGLPRCHIMATNPPFGWSGKLAVAFIEAGLRRLPTPDTMALLLPHDFDAGKTRVHLFRDNLHYLGKIILMRRVMWFEHPTDPNVGPIDNSAWFVWRRVERKGPPILMYAPVEEAAS